MTINMLYMPLFVAKTAVSSVTIPATSDDTSFGFIVAAAVISLALVIILAVWGKKRK